MVGWVGARNFFRRPPRRKKKGDCRGVRIGFEVEKMVETACEGVAEGGVGELRAWFCLRETQICPLNDP